jgi:hypothetical protein
VLRRRISCGPRRRSSPRSSSCCGRAAAEVARICHAPDADRRDGFLLGTLARFGSACEPRLAAILGVFTRLFATRTGERFLATAARAAQTRVESARQTQLEAAVPEMVAPLVRILETTQPSEPSVEVLKPFGTAFDTIESDSFAFPSHLEAGESCTSLVFTGLIRVLRVMTIVVENDPENCRNFVPDRSSCFSRVWRSSPRRAHSSSDASRRSPS